MNVRPRQPRSRDITKIFEEIVSLVPNGLHITYTDYNEEEIEVVNPHVNYVFGNTQYVKATLDEMSKGRFMADEKLPMIALFNPIVEDRGNPDYYAVVKVNVLIACQTNRDWSNEQRRDYSFVNVLRPIYDRFIEELKADGRFDFGYNTSIKHSYSENYSYGKYGAFTSTGEEVSEPIDAIDIRNLELKITHQNCRTQ
ncbi:MAG: hypothetical protein HUK14_06050 [Muribaculaceae bacterium]|nr:hypothetical protein [Muribaculaceae bacterium]